MLLIDATRFCIADADGYVAIGDYDNGWVLEQELRHGGLLYERGAGYDHGTRRD